MAYAELDEIESLIASKKDAEALEWLNTHMDEFPKRYYPLLMFKLEVLERLGKDDEALRIIEEELRMPYIPRPFNESLAEIHQQFLARHRTAKTSPQSMIRHLNNSEFGQQLPTLIKHHDLEVILDELRERSLRDLAPAIQGILSDMSVRQVIKALILQTLCDVREHTTYTYPVDGCLVEVIPSELSAIDLSAIAEAILHPLLTEIRQPSARYFFDSLLTQYLLNHYPIVPEVDEYHLLAVALYHVFAKELSLSVNSAFIEGTAKEMEIIRLYQAELAVIKQQR